MKNLIIILTILASTLMAYSNPLKTIYSFQQNTTGLGPMTRPVVGPHGTIYVVTAHGGTIGNGTITALTPGPTNYTAHILHNFTDNEGWLAEGRILLKNGWIYGTSLLGGPPRKSAIYRQPGEGLAWRCNTNGTFQTLLVFQDLGIASPVMAGFRDTHDGNSTNGDDLITTFQSGTTNDPLGGILCYNTASGKVTTITNGLMGEFPTGTPAPDPSHPGDFLFTSWDTYPINNPITTGFINRLHIEHTNSFIAGISNASTDTNLLQPAGTIVTTSNGWMFGTCTTSNAIFCTTRTNWHFLQLNGLSGSNTIDGLTDGHDGWLYGATTVGGVHDCGAIYRIPSNGNNPAGVQVLAQFTTNNQRAGSAPYMGPNHVLYGTTQMGGTYDNGTVYALDLKQFHGPERNRCSTRTLTRPSDPGSYYTLWESTNLTDWTKITNSVATTNTISFTLPKSPKAYFKTSCP